MSGGEGSMSVGRQEERETYGAHREGLEGRRGVDTRKGLRHSQQKRHPDNWVPDLQPSPSDLKPRTQVYSTAAVSHQGSFNR